VRLGCARGEPCQRTAEGDERGHVGLFLLSSCTACPWSVWWTGYGFMIRWICIGIYGL
jgi:hypothetical protein